MRKHPLVKNMRKMNFHLVPVKGAVKTNGGKFRAEFVRGINEGDNRGTLGVDEVIAEAIEKHKLNGVSPDMLRLYVEAVLQTMIDKTLADGRARRIDDYLSVSLGIHGGFDEKTDDFDFDRHSVDFTVRALNAFKPTTDSIYPVNVNRKKQFRLSYVTAADGLHRNHEVVYGQDFIIRGSGLDMPKLWDVIAHVRAGANTIMTVDVPVKERTESQILCGWPEDVGIEHLRERIEFTVGKYAEDFDKDDDKHRTVHAGILPA